FYAQFPTAVQIIFGSGISSAAIFTVVMNLLFNHLRAGTPENPSVFAAGTGRVITEKQFRRLQEGDYVKDGKLHRPDCAAVPVASVTVRTSGQPAWSRSALWPADSCSTGTARSPNSGVNRASGPEMDSAVGVGAPSTGTAKQRTPISCSPSSTS